MLLFLLPLPCSGWTQLGSDIYADVATSAFGDNVALNAAGTVLAVGAPLKDGNNSLLSASGQVRVFEYVNSAWAPRGAPINGQAADDNFGNAVSLNHDGTVLAVGAHQANGFQGQVRVFQYSSGSWAPLGAVIGSEGGLGSFGSSVSLNKNGDILAAGDRLANGNQGIVRVFQYSNSTWSLLGAPMVGLTGSFEFGLKARLGTSVSLNSAGNKVVVGALRYSQVYELSNASWVQLGPDIAGGESVSLSSDGDVVAVGKSLDAKARVFQYANGNWSRMGGPLGGDGNSVVSLNGDGYYVAVGCSSCSSGAKVKVFHYSTGTWEQVGAELPGGNSKAMVSLNRIGNILAVGMPEGNSLARVFQSTLTSVSIFAPPPPVSSSSSSPPPPIISPKSLALKYSGLSSKDSNLVIGVSVGAAVLVFLLFFAVCYVLKLSGSAGTTEPLIRELKAASSANDHTNAFGASGALQSNKL